MVLMLLSRAVFYKRFNFTTSKQLHTIHFFQMLIRFSIGRIVFAAFIAAGFFSCKKGVESRPSWDASILAPLLESSLSINDLLADSLIQTNSDNSVSLVFSNPLYHLSLTDQAVDIPDTTIRAAFSLQSLNLADQTIVYPLTLGQICAQLGIAGLFIILANTSYFTLTPLNDITTGETEIDATQFFQSADLEAGFID